jgi:hypothetical protein
VTPGNLEFVDYVVSLAVGIGGSAAIVLRDERRLTPEQLARAWPPTSRNVALYAFSPFCVAVHFVRTRRSWIGFFWGVLWVAVIVGADNALEVVAEHAADWLGV